VRTIGAYYNEFDPQAAAWLRELIKRGHIADGDVDDRDMREISPDDIKGYAQHHFFAGIAGWSLALRLAGWPDDRPVLTGSPPCQPFSSAGKGRGAADDRHLAPKFLELVAALRPTVLFGEQVAAAINKHDWLDDLLDALEEEGYATGAIVLPACGLGAPHIRQRLWFTGRLADATGGGCSGSSRSGGAKEQRAAERGVFGRVAQPNGGQRQRIAEHGEHEQHRQAGGRQQGDGELAGSGADSGLADADSAGLDRRPKNTGSETWACPRATDGSEALRLADADSDGRKARNTTTQTARHGYTADAASGTDRHGSTHAPAAGWDDPDWLFCRDGKWRPVESGTFPLANGLPARVGRLRGYGNAIVPQVAAEVIKVLMESGE